MYLDDLFSVSGDSIVLAQNIFMKYRPVTYAKFFSDFPDKYNQGFMNPDSGISSDISLFKHLESWEEFLNGMNFIF